MSIPDVAPPPAAPDPGLSRHLARIALLCAALLAGVFVGALVAAFANRASGPFGTALDRADDVSEPLLVVAAIAALSAGLRAALGRGMARRRNMAALRRRWRRWGWLAHLAWIPALVIVVTAEGWVLLIAFATPIILAGLLLAGSSLSAGALRGRRPTYAVAVVIGLAIGLAA